MDTSSNINWDSISEVQQYIVNWADDRFPNRTPHQALSKLVLEELPEMLQAKNTGVALDQLEGEWADTLILLLDLAKLWGINPSRGLRNKMMKNNLRQWKLGDGGLFHHVGEEDGHR